MLDGLRTCLIGYHNPLIHGYYIIKAWKKLFNCYPNSREFVCILLHDIGYITQRDGCLNVNDNHPELGAKICEKLFGKNYYFLMISHSRDYAKKNKIELSKLCYADKYAALLIPLSFHYFIGVCDKGEWNKEIIKKYRKNCKEWLNKNKWRVYEL